MSGVPSRIAVVGASLAGLSTARALRARGYDGELVIIGAETHRPYDRPPLSKEFLGSEIEPEELALEATEEDLDATWVLGTHVARLVARPDGGAVLHLATDRTVEADAVVLATGAAARRNLPGADLPGVHVLRTFDDAVGLRADLQAAASEGRTAVVVGGGFIGSEVAATARKLGCEVVLVVAEEAPLQAALGPYADAVAGLHAEHGVKVRTHSFVSGVRVSDDGLDVVLRAGDRLPAATVVLGLGAVPATAWLDGSGLDFGPDGGVHCDESGATALPGVYAVGDCSSWWAPALGRHQRIEHWTAAKERGALVAARVLGEERLPRQRAPYVWSDLYGRRLQIAGEPAFADAEPEIESGSLADRSFAAVYRRNGEPVAVVGLDHVRHVTGLRKRLVVPTPAPSAPIPSDSDARTTQGALS